VAKQWRRCVCQCPLPLPFSTFSPPPLILPTTFYKTTLISLSSPIAPTSLPSNKFTLSSSKRVSTIPSSLRASSSNSAPFPLPRTSPTPFHSSIPSNTPTPSSATPSSGPTPSPPLPPARYNSTTTCYTVASTPIPTPSPFSLSPAPKPEPPTWGNSSTLTPSSSPSTVTPTSILPSFTCTPNWVNCTMLGWCLIKVL